MVGVSFGKEMVRDVAESEDGENSVIEQRDRYRNQEARDQEHRVFSRDLAQDKPESG